jgi:hypothetical protein
MRYIKMGWKHEHRDEPVLLYSELDDASWEVRKVEVFRNRSLGHAGGSQTRGTTMLGLAPVPPLAEIAVDPEFEPTQITKDEFEEMWSRAVRSP